MWGVIPNLYISKVCTVKRCLSGYAIGMETPKQKPCKACGKTKPIEDFYRHAAHRDGHFGRCKDCMNAAAKARFERDPEAARAKARERYRKMREAGGWKVVSYGR